MPAGFWKATLIKDVGLKLRLIPSLCNTTKMNITNKSSKSNRFLGFNSIFSRQVLGSAAFIEKWITDKVKGQGSQILRFTDIFFLSCFNVCSTLVCIGLIRIQTDLARLSGRKHNTMDAHNTILNE